MAHLPWRYPVRERIACAMGWAAQQRRSHDAATLRGWHLVATTDAAHSAVRAPHAPLRGPEQQSDGRLHRHHHALSAASHARADRAQRRQSARQR